MKTIRLFCLVLSVGVTMWLTVAYGYLVYRVIPGSMISNEQAVKNEISEFAWGDDIAILKTANRGNWMSVTFVHTTAKGIADAPNGSAPITIWFKVEHGRVVEQQAEPPIIH